MSTLAVIVGPTGVGKTHLSIRLAQRWHCPIVNCDSRQIYHQLPIGTASPTAQEMAEVKHYLVGTHLLNETYNAGQYERDALQILHPLSQQATASTPFAILSGGSMLYVDAVCNGLDDIPAIPPHIRERLQQDYRNNGLEWLQQQVMEKDPAYYHQADIHNPQRLLHCLEVTLGSGQPYSSFRTHQTSSRPWDTLKIGLLLPREELYARINLRVEQMIAAGLEEEARQAYEKMGCPKELPNSLNTVGYREMIEYFRGKCTRAEAIRLIQQNTRHYAKRQMTWFRAQKDIHWMDMNQPIENIIQQIENLKQ